MNRDRRDRCARTRSGPAHPLGRRAQEEGREGEDEDEPGDDEAQAADERASCPSHAPRREDRELRRRGAGEKVGRRDRVLELAWQ